MERFFNHEETKHRKLAVLRKTIATVEQRESVGKLIKEAIIFTEKAA